MHRDDLIEQIFESSTDTKGRLKGYNGVIPEIPLAVFAENTLGIPEPSYETCIECDYPTCIIPSPLSSCVPCEDVDTGLPPLRSDVITSEFGEFVAAPCPLVASSSVVALCPVEVSCPVNFIEEKVDWIALEKCLAIEANERVTACMQAEICHNDHVRKSEREQRIPCSSTHNRSFLSQWTRSLSQVTRPLSRLWEGRIYSQSQKSTTPLQQYIFPASQLGDFKEFIHQFCSLSKLKVSLNNLFYPPCDYNTDKWCVPSHMWDSSIRKINRELSIVKAPFKLVGEHNYYQDRADYKFAVILHTRDTFIINQLNSCGIERISVADKPSKHRVVTL